MKTSKLKPTIEVRKISFQLYVEGIDINDIIIIGYIARAKFDCDDELVYRSSFDRVEHSGKNITKLLTMPLGQYTQANNCFYSHLQDEVEAKEYLFRNPIASAPAAFELTTRTTGYIINNGKDSYNLQVVYENAFFKDFDTHEFKAVKDVLLNGRSLKDALAPEQFRLIYEGADSVVQCGWEWSDGLLNMLNDTDYFKEILQ